MKVLKVLTICILFITHTLFGQWNIQTGYDFGTMKLPSNNSNVTINSKWDFVQRLNLIGEYSFRNNILLSIDSGTDFHNILRDQQRTTSNSSGDGLAIYSGRFDARIQTYRIGLGFGYALDISDNSKITIKLSINQFFVNSIRLIEWNVIKSIYDNQSADEPTSIEKEFPNPLNYDKIGLRNKWTNENNSGHLSLEYRYRLSNMLSLNTFFGYSPFDKRIYPRTSIRRNSFILGLRLGYTLPQKNKNDEK